MFLKVGITALIILILLVGGGLYYLTRGLESGEQLAVSNVNLAQLADGEYVGSYDSGRWTNEVRVTIADHQITALELLRDIRFARPEVTEELFDNIISEQRVDIDVISGATVSCRAYLKAVENALRAPGKH